MDPQLYPWIILFAPLVAAAFILFVLPRNNVAAGAIGILTAALTCFLSWKVFLDPTLAVTAQLSRDLHWFLGHDSQTVCRNTRSQSAWVWRRTFQLQHR